MLYWILKDKIEFQQAKSGEDIQGRVNDMSKGTEVGCTIQSRLQGKGDTGTPVHSVHPRRSYKSTW